MHHLKKIITVLVLSLSMNVFAEDTIDTDYYVSSLSCETEVIENDSSTNVTNQDTIELPEFVVTCKVNDSIMVGLKAE